MVTVQELQKKYLPAVAPEDFFLLLAHAIGKERVFLLAHPEYPLTPEVVTTAKKYLKRRLAHEPVAYILGHKEFYGRDFSVTSDTLIPRPETELLIEQVLDRVRNIESGIMKEIENLDIVDIGTGSGNIIITLAKEFSLFMRHASCVNFYAIDISSQALAIARKNAQAHNIEKQIDFVESDLLKNFPHSKRKNTHAIIIANLPYLSETIYEASDADVREYEPKSALVSGADGLDHYRRLLIGLQEFPKHYRSVTIFLEISPEQADLVKQLVRDAFHHAAVHVIQDLSGRSRLFQASF